MDFFYFFDNAFHISSAKQVNGRILLIFTGTNISLKNTVVKIEVKKNFTHKFFWKEILFILFLNICVVLSRPSASRSFSTEPEATGEESPP